MRHSLLAWHDESRRRVQRIYLPAIYSLDVYKNNANLAHLRLATCSILDLGDENVSLIIRRETAIDVVVGLSDW